LNFYCVITCGEVPDEAKHLVKDDKQVTWYKMLKENVSNLNASITGISRYKPHPDSYTKS
jgi:hypothetical protein